MAQGVMVPVYLHILPPDRFQVTVEKDEHGFLMHYREWTDMTRPNLDVTESMTKGIPGVFNVQRLKDGWSYDARFDAFGILTTVLSELVLMRRSSDG